MRYGELPRNLGLVDINCHEMMFYQYLPIKLIGQTVPTVEKRLEVFNEVIGKICCDFIANFGLNKYIESYVYLTAKHMYQGNGIYFNRGGYHTDGFLTEDINYIWSDKFPTVFNTSSFNLSMDDVLSCKEMEEQAAVENEYTFKNGSLLCLNQYNVHKIAQITEGAMRTFLKVSFSKDKYDLMGNSKNHLLSYDWDMRQRLISRNIPQKI